MPKAQAIQINWQFTGSAGIMQVEHTAIISQSMRGTYYSILGNICKINYDKWSNNFNNKTNYLNQRQSLMPHTQNNLDILQI